MKSETPAAKHQPADDMSPNAFGFFIWSICVATLSLFVDPAHVTNFYEMLLSFIVFLSFLQCVSSSVLLWFLVFESESYKTSTRNWSLLLASIPIGAYGIINSGLKIPF